MYSVEVYRVEPESIALHQSLGLAAVVITAVVSAFLVMRFGLRSWKAIAVAAIVFPTMMALAAGVGQPGPTWPLTILIVEVVGPLAVLGFAAGVAGSALGALLRWLLRSRAS
jgi:hypothetical protein